MGADKRGERMGDEGRVAPPGSPRSESDAEGDEGDEGDGEGQNLNIPMVADDPIKQLTDNERADHRRARNSSPLTRQTPDEDAQAGPNGPLSSHASPVVPTEPLSPGIGEVSVVVVVLAE
jgi:hypothetical protein